MTSTMKKENKKKNFIWRARLTLLTKLMTSTSYEINYNFFPLCVCVPVVGWLTFGFTFYFRKPLSCRVGSVDKRINVKVKKLTRSDITKMCSTNYGAGSGDEKECHVRCLGWLVVTFSTQYKWHFRKGSDHGRHRSEWSNKRTMDNPDIGECRCYYYFVVQFYGNDDVRWNWMKQVKPFDDNKNGFVAKGQRASRSRYFPMGHGESSCFISAFRLRNKLW